MQEMTASQAASSADAQRMMVILHPDAWRASTQIGSDERLQQVFAQHGLRVDIRLISEEDPAAKLVECALIEGYAGVIAAGGDGTIQQVATCLMRRAIPLGILPLGTMNNIAYSLGIPTDLMAAIQIIEAGVVRKIDMGILNGAPFLEVANIGTEVEMSEVVEATRHRSFLTMLRSTAQGLSALLRQRRHHLTLEIDGKRYLTRAWEVTVCNMPYYGLRYHPDPATRIDDGLLDVIILRHRALLGLVGYYWDLLWQRFGVSPQVSILRARRVTITARRPIPIGISGYREGTTPATIESAPGALRVFAPIPHPTMRPRREHPLANILQSLMPASVRNRHSSR